MTERRPLLVKMKVYLERLSWRDYMNKDKNLKNLKVKDILKKSWIGKNLKWIPVRKKMNKTTLEKMIFLEIIEKEKLGNMKPLKRLRVWCWMALNQYSLLIIKTFLIDWKNVMSLKKNNKTLIQNNNNNKNTEKDFIQ